MPAINKYFAACNNTGTAPQRIISSPDGVTWSDALPWSAGVIPDSTTYIQSLFQSSRGIHAFWINSVGGGTAGLFFSTDGATWTSTSSIPQNSWTAAVGPSNRVVAVSANGAVNAAMYSDDGGATWTSVATGGAIGDCIAANSAMWVAGNSASAGGLRYSTNGTSWTSVATISGTASMRFSNVVWVPNYNSTGAGRWFAFNNFGDVVESSNGTSWTKKTTTGYTTASMYGACVTVGNLIAIANTNTSKILLSDATMSTWTASSTTLSQPARGIASDSAGNYVAVGFQTGFTSTDLSNWTSRTVPSLFWTSLMWVGDYAVGAGSLGVATAISPSTAFGQAVSVSNVASGFRSTQFGSPQGGRQVFATALGSSVTFGAAARNLNFSFAASASIPNTGFGLATAIRSVLPAPIVATGIAPGTAFGLPSVLAVRTGIATGFTSTVIPEAMQTRSHGATALAPTLQFGGASSGYVCSAGGFSFTAFGAPRTGTFGQVAGFQSAQLGTPGVVARVTGAAPGFKPTAFGTPNGANNMQRTRSGVFRTQFGKAQAERTRP